MANISYIIQTVRRKVAILSGDIWNIWQSASIRGSSDFQYQLIKVIHLKNQHRDFYAQWGKCSFLAEIVSISLEGRDCFLFSEELTLLRSESKSDGRSEIWEVLFLGFTKKTLAVIRCLTSLIHSGIRTQFNTEELLRDSL